MLLILTERHNPCLAVIGATIAYHDCDRSIIVRASLIFIDLVIVLSIGPRKEKHGNQDEN